LKYICVFFFTLIFNRGAGLQGRALGWISTCLPIGFGGGDGVVKKNRKKQNDKNEKCANEISQQLKLT